MLFATPRTRHFPAVSVPFLARQLETGVIKKGRERSAPLEERVNGGECSLLCIRGQHEWNVLVIKTLGGLVLFGSCHNGVFDS